MTSGEKIKSIRKQAGMSQEKAAEKLEGIQTGGYKVGNGCRDSRYRKYYGHLGSILYFH